MNAPIGPFPFKTHSESPVGDAAIMWLFRRSSLVTLKGRVERIDVGWAGAARCRLATSIGSVTVDGNRESIPLELQRGAYVQVRMLKRYTGGEIRFSVTTMTPISEVVTSAWVPKALCHREAHMRRLTHLLGKLQPPIQTAFMAAMDDAQLQRKFFWRVSAADHHCYPGGLFDQSIHAAEAAFSQTYASDRERSVATFAALMFDIGKAFSPFLTSDDERGTTALSPHRLTVARLERASQALETFDPAAAALLHAVLEVNPGSAVGGPPEAVHVAQHVRKAVRLSWGLPSMGIKPSP